MLIGRVVGNVIATQKNEKLEGAKLLLVQPLDLEGREKGVAVLAIDTLVDAGIGDIGILEAQVRAPVDEQRLVGLAHQALHHVRAAFQ